MDKNLWRAVQERVPFRVARRLLASNAFPRGASWTAIEDKLKAKNVAATADFDGLKDSYRETLIATEKSLHIYTVSKSGIATLRRVAAAAKPAGGAVGIGQGKCLV